MYVQLPNRPERTGPRLLIIRPSALGDVSRSVPALATLRKAFPDARIDWMVNHSFADAIAGHPMLDGLILFDRRGMARFGYGPKSTSAGITLIRCLRQQRYDQVFDLQGLLRSGLFAWLCGASQRVGYANAREGAWLCYNRRHHVDARLHSVDRMLALLQAHGLEIHKDMRLYVPDDDQQWLAQQCEMQALTPDDYVCLAPTAQWLCKCWPLTNYAQLLFKMIRAGMLTATRPALLLGGPHELDQLEHVVRLVEEQGGEAAALKWLRPQRTSVGQMMALISRCRLLIGNDSAPLHVATGFDRPIVGLYGPTDPALVGPYGRDDQILQPPQITASDMAHYRKHRDDQRLISRITVDSVFDQVASHFNTSSANASSCKP